MQEVEFNSMHVGIFGFVRRRFLQTWNTAQNLWHFQTNPTLYVPPVQVLLVKTAKVVEKKKKNEKVSKMDFQILISER